MFTEHHQYLKNVTSFDFIDLVCCPDRFEESNSMASLKYFMNLQLD